MSEAETTTKAPIEVVTGQLTELSIGTKEDKPTRRRYRHRKRGNKPKAEPVPKSGPTKMEVVVINGKKDAEPEKQEVNKENKDPKGYKSKGRKRRYYNKIWRKEDNQSNKDEPSTESTATEASATPVDAEAKTEEDTGAPTVECAEPIQPVA